MTTITNDLGLPDAIVRAVANDDYSRGDSDITVTELIDPPRKVALTVQHVDEIVEDASDRIWALMGQAIHTVLERANVQDSVEDRLYIFVEGWKIGGKYDNLALTDDPQYGRILTDYKSVSVWEVIHGLKPERAAQLNVLGWLARRNGHRVDRLEAVCIIRDWSKSRARRQTDDYPQRQVMRYFVPTWPDAKVEGYVHERVLLHQQARRSLPQCSNEERWYEGTKYAVMKAGRKSALRVLDSLEDATAWALSKGHANTSQFGDLESTTLNKGISIATRTGAHKRCLDYCSVASFCDQWAAIRASGGGEEEEPADEGEAA